MVHLFSRLARLLSRVSRSNIPITEIDSPTAHPISTPASTDSPLNHNLNTDGGLGMGIHIDTASGTLHPPDLLNSTLPLLGYGAAAVIASSDPLVEEARQLNRDVDAWIESLLSASGDHERVQVGNRAYAFSMKVGFKHWL
jgi:hypothetical protein